MMIGKRVSVEEQQIKSVVKDFGITEVKRIELFHGGFNANWLITTSNGKFILKRRAEEEREKSIKEALLSNILSGKISTASVVMASSGSPEVTKKGWCYTLFEFVEGRKYDYSDADLSRLAATMARMHAATRNPDALTIENVPDFRWNAIDWSNSYVEKCKKGGLVNQNTIAKAKEILAKARRRVGKAERSSELERTMVHWDFHPGNVLIAGSKVYIFDLEFAHIDNRTADIANSIILLTALDMAKIRYDDAATFIQRCEIDLDKLYVFIKSYSGVYKLSAEEVFVLPAYLEIAWLGWVFYTFYKMPRSKAKESDSLYFAQWVEDNIERIAQTIGKGSGYA